ncbi:hypothetical protein BJ322DRAFT_999170 [Thelephora terrestris]|uniref:PARP catalytic domain-containing protein n=1 Tax=Thelephora terrestris TaxID=56493 RepID=A0A9P6HLY4_9AGAM|nr:hypothetical protein BJ322DRAFT_999170 [Thelephora terrestris]
MARPPQNCKSKPKYADGDVVHPYCSKRCASSARSNRPTAHRTKSAVPLCRIPGCSSRVYVGRSGGTGHYCSKAHLRLGTHGCICCRKASAIGPTCFCQSCGDEVFSVAPMIIEVPKDHERYKGVESQFRKKWQHNNNCPEVRAIYKIVGTAESLEKYEQYINKIEAKGNYASQGKTRGNENRRWHGTTRECNIGDKGVMEFCSDPSCSLCCIMKFSFDLTYSENAGMFGGGIYTTSTSSKSDQFSFNSCASGWKPMLLNRVVVGKGYRMTTPDAELTGPPAGYDSVLAEASDSGLNYDELVVYDNDAIRPSYLVMSTIFFVSITTNLCVKHWTQRFRKRAKVYPYCGRTCAKLAAKKKLVEEARLKVHNRPAPPNPPIHTDSHQARSEHGCVFCRAAPMSNASVLCQPCLDVAPDMAGILKVPEDHRNYKGVEKQFKQSWRHETVCPEVKAIYKIVVTNAIMGPYQEYLESVEAQWGFVAQGKPRGNENRRWHGTRRKCTLGDPGNEALCADPGCSLCCIIRESFDIKYYKMATSWGRFGRGIYTSSTSSKCNDYSMNMGAESEWKTLLLNTVIVGNGKKLINDDISLTGPPPGFDSILAEVVPGGALNYDELVVYKNEAIRPSYLVVYSGAPTPECPRARLGEPESSLSGVCLEITE